MKDMFLVKDVDSTWGLAARFLIIFGFFISKLDASKKMKKMVIKLIV